MEHVHISTIKQGDTVFHDGHLRTVSGNVLKRGGFCGTTLWGDSYRSGTILVKKVTDPKEITELNWPKK